MKRGARKTFRRTILIGTVPVVAFLTGCCLSSPAYHGPKSDHFDGRQFHNRDGEEQKSIGGFLKWMMNRKHGVWHDHRGEQPGAVPAPLVLGTALRVTFVNHATVLIQTDGINVLTDPIWSKRASPFSWAGPKRRRDPGIRFEDLPKIDVVIVSHNHYDHMDLPTLKRLVQRDHPRIFSGLGNSKFLGKHGIESRDLDWWEAADLGRGIRLSSVPSKHFSGRGTLDAKRTLWTSFVLEAAGGSVYFAGDTGYGKHFAEIGRRFPGLRLALIPIGAYEPRWFMKPVHMNPSDAVHAFTDLHPVQAVAIHYGTFELTDEGEDDPAKSLTIALDSAGIAHASFRVLGFGESFDLP